jgi:hypothetical protein
MTDQDLVVAFDIDRSVCCGSGHVYDLKHSACPKCGDSGQAHVRVALPEADRAVPFELFLLRELEPKEESGPHVVSAMQAQVRSEEAKR